MVALKCENQQLYCCEAMLKHDVFVLTPDIDAKHWRLYSAAKYLALQQKLLVADAQLGAENSARLAHIMRGSCLELQRQGNVIPLSDNFTEYHAELQVVWLPD
ncbi:hypothetical protein [Rheinheimera nanhaiensis]|uniref:Uncharacterized protein n=1 Tax=Rheinheimera nanhaiensis E407-8 TaxID=562729 RepID=I1DXK0_9GAMM|nr:hypothetical protein [Rheinheimera nanhaiensis]GAB58778.1 hypothetical protein RNAN_1766 [Rheinheimera nanhaiensis E407-8]